MSGRGEPTEADARYLAEIEADLTACLGPGIELVDLRRADGEDGIRLVARYRLGSREWASEAIGETVVAAHGELRARLLLDRIRLGFTGLVEGA